jgi:hypothetical protein
VIDSPRVAMPTSTPPDLSFTRYVARRKQAAAARMREGAVYAHAADLRVRSTLRHLRPVTMATEAAIRNFTESGMGTLLEGATALAPDRFGTVHGSLVRAAAALGIDLPEAHVCPSPRVLDVLALGPTQAPIIAIPAAFLDRLSPTELLAALGFACGQIHSEHTPFLTTLYFLNYTDNTALRWISKPALVALSAWADRAAITADRASLLVVRDLAAAKRSLCHRHAGLTRLSGEFDADKFIDGISTDSVSGNRDDVIRLRRRLAALAVFARTSFYRSGLTDSTADGTPAITLGQCEIETSALFSESV